MPPSPVGTRRGANIFAVRGAHAPTGKDRRPPRSAGHAPSAACRASSRARARRISHARCRMAADRVRVDAQARQARLAGGRGMHWRGSGELRGANHADARERGEGAGFGSRQAFSGGAAGGRRRWCGGCWRSADEALLPAPVTSVLAAVYARGMRRTIILYALCPVRHHQRPVWRVGPSSLFSAYPQPLICSAMFPGMVYARPTHRHRTRT